jgi:hypothetical protein
VEGYGSVRTAGWLTVTAVDESSALAKIDFSCDSIEPGDYLETFAEPAMPERTADMAEPKFSDRARVLFGTDRRNNLGDGDLFSIDRGREQGIATGDRFAIYRDRRERRAAGPRGRCRGDGTVREDVEGRSRDGEGRCLLRRPRIPAALGDYGRVHS